MTDIKEIKEIKEPAEINYWKVAGIAALTVATAPLWMAMVIVVAQVAVFLGVVGLVIYSAKMFYDQNLKTNEPNEHNEPKEHNEGKDL